MRPIEEERWEEVDRSLPADPRTDPRAGAPNRAVRPLEPVREEHYGRTTVLRSADPRIERVIWFIVAVVDSLIAIRFFMKLLGASYQADFVRFMYGVTGPFVGPFKGIFQASGSGNNALEPESVIAIAIYLLLGWAMVALVRIVSTPRARPVA